MTTAVKTQEQKQCYLCGCEGDILYEDLSDFLFEAPGEWNLRQCNNNDCRLIWLDPLPHPDEVWKLYTSYYTHGKNDEASEPKPEKQIKDFSNPIKSSSLGMLYGYPSIVGNTTHKLLGKIMSLSPSRRARMGNRIFWARGDWGSRMLDIGCGSGKLLTILSGLGWDCTGYEIDPKAAETARIRTGATVYEGDIKEIANKEEPFDLIASSHVMEHLIDPVEDLKYYKSLLKPGGRIVMATPNFDSLGHKLFGRSWRGLEPPRHFHIFNTKTLARCIEKAGMEVESIGTNPSPARKLFRTSRIIKKEHFVKEGMAEHPPKYAKKGSRLFSLVEHLLNPFHLGEELVAVARKKG